MLSYLRTFIKYFLIADVMVLISYALGREPLQYLLSGVILCGISGGLLGMMIRKAHAMRLFK